MYLHFKSTCRFKCLIRKAFSLYILPLLSSSWSWVCCVSSSKLPHRFCDSHVLHCVPLCGASYTKHNYLTYRLWTHVSDAIRMNDQVGELCLFTDRQNIVLGSLCSVVKLKNLNPELCGFMKSLNNLLNNDNRITTFRLSKLLIYFCALIVSILSSLLSLLCLI